MTSTLQEYLETGLKLDGHNCPATPMGIFAGLVALQTLGIGQAENEENVLVCIPCSGRDSREGWSMSHTPHKPRRCWQTLEE